MSNNVYPSDYGFYGNGALNATSLCRVSVRTNLHQKNNRENSTYLNLEDERIEIDQLKKIFCSRYTWRGCEFLEEMPPGYVEMILFSNGFAIAYEDAQFGFIIMPATVNERNVFYQPANYLVNGNGWERIVDAGKCVLIRDNDIWEAPLSVATRQGSLIADAGRTCENLVNSAKLLDVFITDDRKTKTAEDYANYKINNVPFLILSKKDDTDTIVSSKNPREATEAILNMQQVKQNYRAEAHARMGVASNEYKKSAYTSSEEMGDSNNYNSLLLEAGKQNRLKGVDQIKQMFGVNIELIDNSLVIEEQEEKENDDE